MRASWSGHFRMGMFQMPIATYKKCDGFSITTKTHHSGCGGAVRQRLECELHPGEEVSGNTFFGITIGDITFEITDDDRKRMTLANEPMEVIAALKLSDVNAALGKSLITMEPYQIGAPSGSEVVKAQNEMVLSTILDRLRIRKQVLLVTFPNSIKRFGLLLSSGVLYPLFYNEELRDSVSSSWNVKPSKEFTQKVNEWLDGLSGEIPDLTISPIQQSVARSIAARQNPDRKSKITATGDDEKKSQKKVATRT